MTTMPPITRGVVSRDGEMIGIVRNVTLHSLIRRIPGESMWAEHEVVAKTFDLDAWIAPGYTFNSKTDVVHCRTDDRVLTLPPDVADWAIIPV